MVRTVDAETPAIGAQSAPNRTALPGDGPWLIWSRHWGRWHRRSVDDDGSEHATGYTDELMKAGIFGRKLAEAYHDPKGRDQAIPVAQQIQNMERRAADAEAEAVGYRAKVASFQELVRSEATITEASQGNGTTP